MKDDILERTLSPEELKGLEYHIEECLKILKIPKNTSTERTPYRIAKMWAEEVFINRNNDYYEEFKESLRVFPNEAGNNLVVMKDIPFSSMCEHHFMPFIGSVTVGYVPEYKMIGLSKIPRIIKYFSKMPQVQERYTKQIAEMLYDITTPLAVYVSVTAEHTCVSCRGIESEGKTTTFYKIERDEKLCERFEREFKEELRR